MMNLADKIIDIIFWILPVYVLATIVLTIRFWTIRNDNKKSKEFINKIISIVNIIFIICFLTMTFYDMAVTKRQYIQLGLGYEYDSSDWSLIISSFIFLIALCFRKFRRSPYSMLGISIVIIINILIAYSNVAIVV